MARGQPALQAGAEGFASPPRAQGWNWSWPRLPTTAQQGLQEVPLATKLAAKLEGCRALGVSKAPTTGTTQQGPKGSAGFSGDTGETQRS